MANFDGKLKSILRSIKKQLIISHYQQELKLRQLEQTHHRLDRLREILAIEKLLQAAELEDWDLIEAIVPQTSTPEESSH